MSAKQTRTQGSGHDRDVHSRGARSKEERDMPQLNAYLIFDGKAAEAMRFYERILGGRLEDVMTAAEAPAANPVPPGSADRLVNARLVFEGGSLLAMDARVGEPYRGMNGFLVSLAYPTVAEARRVFEALARDGRVTMPFDKTFWAEGVGMLVDRFGTPWMVSTER
jgi:PhnB protein